MFISKQISSSVIIIASLAITQPALAITVSFPSPSSRSLKRSSLLSASYSLKKPRVALHARNSGPGHPEISFKNTDIRHD